MEDLTKAAKLHYGAAAYEERKEAAVKIGVSVEEYYLREKNILSVIRRCNECKRILPGFYLCCSDCEQIYSSNNCNKSYIDCYNLCVECYYEGTFNHQHDSFADNHSILTMIEKGSRHPPCGYFTTQKKQKGKELQTLECGVKVKDQQTEELNKGKGGKEDNQDDIQRVAKQSYTRPPAETRIILLDDKGKHNEDLQIVPIQSNTGQPPAKANTTLVERKMEIDEASMKMLARIAKVHYDAAPQNIRDSADKFWRSMVKKQREKNRVSIEDFKEWMNKNGYTEYGFDKFFEAVVEDREKGMSISESRTVYYILLSGRPFCSNCNNFIPDIQFHCSKCSAKKYALCIDCYESRAYHDHAHYGKDGVFFLDYSVLHTTIKTTTSNNNPPQETQSSSETTAIVKRDKEPTALTVLKVTLEAAGVIIGIASTFGACTIM